MTFPETLDIIKSDLGGDYTDFQDCVIARALKRQGIKEFSVGGHGHVRQREHRNYEVQYIWEGDIEFSSNTSQRTGRLVSRPPGAAGESPE